MKTVKIIECIGKVERDPTSYGNQMSVRLELGEYADEEEMRKKEHEIVNVRIEIEEEQ